MGKADFKMDEAQKYFRERYFEHISKQRANEKIYGPNDGYSHWTFGYNDDWDMIRKLTLHMFNKSVVQQLTDEEAILAVQIAKNIVDIIFDQIDIIGHSQAEIEYKLKGDEDGKNI